MTQINIYQKALEIIKKKEPDFQDSITLEGALSMTEFLQEVLKDLKSNISRYGFINQSEEITFFKSIKPQILGKLIFYNKVYRLEINQPLDQASSLKFYQRQTQVLRQEYKRYLNKSDFYSYYKANRSDKDIEYFTLGQINLQNGINSFAFEIDPIFSTYYDFKIARIIAHNMLYSYIENKIQRPSLPKQTNSNKPETLFWSESQSALIELIYALHASGCLCNGRTEIRKLSHIFQNIFDIPLNDVHHAFHRMKTRTHSRTSFLDKLKSRLEEYMNKDY